MNSLNYNKFKTVLQILDYKYDSTKCELINERLKNTGFIKIVIDIFLVYLNLSNVFTKKHKLNKKIILFKFVAGVTILVYESSTNLKNIKSINIDYKLNNDEIFDSVVVGSGPGGSIASLKMVENGENVLMIESGKYFNQESIEHHSFDQTKLQFANEGMNFCFGNIPMIYAEGETFGGGSEVNSGLYFKLTGHYKKKFLEISEINEEEWNTAEKLVENILSVQNSPNLENTKIKSALIEGSKKNDNITFDEVPRWRKYEPLEESQTMQVTYLKKARDLGLKIICNSSVVGIIPGKEYIEINMLKDNSSSTIKTKKVILSAGTVGTPKILKKSGLLKESVSFNFHPMLRCVVDYGEYVNDGDLFPPFMSWTNDYKHKFAYSVSTYPYIKATLAATGHYDMNINPQNFASYYSSTVFEESKGKILYFKNKSFPFIYVKKKDRKKIKEGFVLLKKILNDGGIKELWPKSDFSPMTAVHIFGSLPLNMSKNIGKNGELNSDSRIKICDASLLPIAPWGNTQAVVMVLNEILMDRWIKQIAKES
tara:strand:- start:1764 stop:3383 length:1620 start_codon:yes stop_codon:yes gene_type:complete